MSKNLPNPRRYKAPAAVRWAKDHDYADKLSPEDKAWLDDFDNTYYYANFGHDTEQLWDKESRRERWRARKCMERDVYSVLHSQQRIQHLPDFPHFEPTGPDVTTPVEPTDSYLSSAKYKKALAEFRGNLRKDLWEFDPPPSAALDKAKETLTKVVTEGMPKAPRKRKVKQ